MVHPGASPEVRGTAASHAEASEPSASIMPWVSWNDPIRYGKWRIYRNDFVAHPAWRTVAWLWVHEDYDGPEDGRCGYAPSVDGCISEIQLWEEDHAA